MNAGQKQYSAVPGIEKVRIVTKWQVIRSFAAMFLDEPHRATGYYAELQNQVGSQGRIFNESHKLEPYYTAAYAYYRLEYLFRNGGIPVYYKPVRFHLLIAVRYVIAGDRMPTLGANKVQSYCNNICETLWDNTKATEAFKRAADAIEAATGDASLTYDLAKTRALSDTVKAYTWVGDRVRGLCHCSPRKDVSIRIYTEALAWMSSYSESPASTYMPVCIEAIV